MNPKVRHTLELLDAQFARDGGLAYATLETSLEQARQAGDLDGEADIALQMGVRLSSIATVVRAMTHRGQQLPGMPTVAWQRLNEVSSSRCPAARQFDPETMSSPLPRDYCERRSALRRPTTRSATRVECIDKKARRLRPFALRHGAGQAPIRLVTGRASLLAAFFGAPLLFIVILPPSAQESYGGSLCWLWGLGGQNIL